MRKYPIWILYAGAMLFLILNGKAAMLYATEGIQLCLYSVIPSLFPFILLSGLLTSALADIKFPGLHRLSQLTHIPQGSELLLVLGYFCGFPVGAQNVCDAYSKGLLSKDCAKRMIIFCNNAGPAFIFGILASQFPNIRVCWYIWSILILSSIITALLLSWGCDAQSSVNQIQSRRVKLLPGAIKAISFICVWVIIFRMILGFSELHLRQVFSSSVSVFLSGLLELTNGCLQLNVISNEFDRFTAAVFMLNTGGLCVTMQTLTVVGELGSSFYVIGKLLQGCIGFILCIVLRPFLFQGTFQSHQVVLVAVSILIVAFCVFYLKYHEKCSRFPQKNIVYYQHRTQLRGKQTCCSEKNSPATADIVSIAQLWTRILFCA